MFNNVIIKEIDEKSQRYIPQIAELEDFIYYQMETSGQSGQFFPTGEEGIREYALSKDNIVMCAIDEITEKIVANAYITQGQVPYTYNDLTKYFKFGDVYKRFVRSQYPTKEAYLKAMTDAYAKKIIAYRYAKRMIMAEHPERIPFKKIISNELTENGFDEKSDIRQALNEYMSTYIMEQNGGVLPKEYEYFYWTSIQELEEESGMSYEPDRPDQQAIYQDMKECSTIFSHQRFNIHETPTFDLEKYFGANTSNTVEIDTYITHPNVRRTGMARIIVYEGLKKALYKYFEGNKDNQEIFICSTLHRDNVSSKYVSEFFGLIDSLFLERRQKLDREVHFTSVTREQYKAYLETIGKKLAVFYGYNPDRLTVTNEERIRFTQEQIIYNLKEIQRLKSLHPKFGTYLHQRLVGKEDANETLEAKLRRLKKTEEQLVATMEAQSLRKGEDR